MSPGYYSAAPAASIHYAATPKDVKQTPQPPKRLRSAFIMFSAEKHKEIRAKLSAQGISEKTTNVAKLVSAAWKGLTPENKKVWEDKAEQDKVRYQAEKATFKGTWKVKRRKDPNAPKRPMSAYLAFSNSRRALATKEHPVATNSEISKILSKMWKEAPPEIKQQYVDREAELRNQYKVAMAQWKKDEKEMKRNSRKTAAAEAKKADNDVIFQNVAYHEQLPTTQQAQNLFPGQPNDPSSLPYALLAIANSGVDGTGRSSGLSHQTSAVTFPQGPSQGQTNTQPSTQSIQTAPYRSPLTELLAGRDPAHAHSQWLSQFSSPPQNESAQSVSVQSERDANSPPQFSPAQNFPTYQSTPVQRALAQPVQGSPPQNLSHQYGVTQEGNSPSSSGQPPFMSQYSQFQGLSSFNQQSQNPSTQNPPFQGGRGNSGFSNSDSGSSIGFSYQVGNNMYQSPGSFHLPTGFGNNGSLNRLNDNSENGMGGNNTGNNTGGTVSRNSYQFGNSGLL